MLIVKYNSLLSSLQWQNVSQNVTLISDEELKIAHAEMKNKMLEVQIKIKQNLNKRYAKDMKIQVLQQYFAKVIPGGKRWNTKKRWLWTELFLHKKYFLLSNIMKIPMKNLQLTRFSLWHQAWSGNINICLVCGMIAGWFVFLSRGEDNVDKGREQV